jgi:hypothetical protein
LCCLLFAGCIGDREPFEAEPYAAIVSLRCDLAGVQIVVEGTFDVRLPPEQSIRIVSVPRLASGTQTRAFAYFGCNEWQTLRADDQQQGCMRLEEQPQTQSISLRATENITDGSLPPSVRVDVSVLVESAPGDDGQVLVERSVTCAR